MTLQGSVSNGKPFKFQGLVHFHHGVKHGRVKKGMMLEAKKKELTVDHLLVNYGFASSSKLLESWALELDHHNIAVNAKNETSIPGVYAIGDIAAQADKLNLMATGFGEAPSVINSALLRIYPEKRQPAHSTQLIKKFEAAQDN